MNEKILNGKKNGMLLLPIFVLLYAASIAGMAIGGMMMDAGKSPALFIVSMVYVFVGWIPFLGFKILRPQEALVLTLFGKYVGTLKGEGFYWVNPFCTAVNPAAKTKLNQSSDVDSGSSKGLNALLGGNAAAAAAAAETSGKRVSRRS